jgi:protein involved in plasmid replication-relaxation
MSGGKGGRYPYGSTAKLRSDVLAVLGVLKVATAEQIMTLMRPELAAGGAKEPTKAHRNAALDLARHKETISEGNTTTGRKLWGLTPLGLESAARVLDRPTGEMGSVARGVGRNGAKHAMAVNDTVTAFVQPAGPARGLGSLAAWSTEVGLPASGTWNKPGPGSARADAVLTAPEDGVPLLFVEVDRGHMSPAQVAQKLENSRRFFRRQVKDTDGREKPMWRTRWHAPPTEREDPHLPVVLVFTGAGPRGLRQRMKAVADLARPSWQPTWTRWSMLDESDGYRTYADRIPVLATTLERLAEHGPWGPAFFRYGHRAWEPVDQALLNADDRHHYWARHEREREAARQAEQEREARRPRCAACGERFTEARWTQVEAEPGGGGEWVAHPELCHNCERAAQQRAEQEREAAHAAAQEAVWAQADEQRPRGFFGRFRP